MIDTSSLKNGDRVVVSRETDDGGVQFDIPCKFVNGLFQDEETNQVYGSTVFHFILVESINSKSLRT